VLSFLGFAGPLADLAPQEEDREGKVAPRHDGDGEEVGEP